ncbi:MAG: hypothetical protein IJ234_10005, partial [Clostridia bacterium]|nr:hypothetical protein [Clostridia bacterium]
MKRILGLICALTLVISLSAGAEGGWSFVQEAPSTAQSFEGIALGDTVEIAQYGAFTPLEFSFEDQIGYYAAGSGMVGAGEHYYESGDEAQYAVLRADIENTSAQAWNYLSDCSVRVTDGATTYRGWSFQQNFANGIAAGSEFGRDSERQNTRWVISASDNFPIAPGLQGHYVFGCSLPNNVVDANGALQMIVTLNGNELTYPIRGGSSEPTQSGAAFVPTAPELTNAPAAPSIQLATIAKGAKGSAVKCLQRTLIELGYLSGSA